MTHCAFSSSYLYPQMMAATASRSTIPNNESVTP